MEACCVLKEIYDFSKKKKRKKDEKKNSVNNVELSVLNFTRKIELEYIKQACPVAHGPYLKHFSSYMVHMILLSEGKNNNGPLHNR